MCSIGLEGWKIVSRFNYILYRFFPPREAHHSPHQTLLNFPFRLFIPREFFFMFFFLFFSFHSNENHLNIIVIFFSLFFCYIQAENRKELSRLIPPNICLRNSHLYKMDGFFFFSTCEMNAGKVDVVVVEEFMCVRRGGAVFFAFLCASSRNNRQ